MQADTLEELAAKIDSKLEGFDTQCALLRKSMTGWAAGRCA
ncbi:hypothetical protein BVG79_p1000173 (plasmid) [Ketogulonicigenium robustum]|uniref:Uncharacterized protein n=1 Tax=Ketogulonicigenium robustum TaxID=92947 RepID=A0A1W6P397_9RHOB|nr:hypothetical protein BVG79_p1000173 [Ketogulonicigenium robustum]